MGINGSGCVRWVRNLAWLPALLLAVGTAPSAVRAEEPEKTTLRKASDWWSENFEVHGFLTSRSYFRTADFSNSVEMSSWRTEINLEAELRLYQGDDFRLGLYTVIRPTYDAVYELQSDLWGEAVKEAAFGTAPAYPNSAPFSNASREGRDLPCNLIASLPEGCGGGQVEGEFTIVNADTGSYFTGELTPAVSIDNILFFGRVTAPVRPRSRLQDDVGGNADGETYEDFADKYGDLVDGQRPGEPNYGAWHNGGLPRGVAGLDASLAMAGTEAGIGFGSTVETPLNFYQGGIGDLKSFERGSFDINRREAQLKWDCNDNAHPACMLRELYLEGEWRNTFFRVGKQQIVWGKTDAFRLQDKLNPIDLGYHNVFPELEERRIPQAAVDLIQSFGDLGPFEDISLEFAWIFDRFIPDQFGQCGEPYAFSQACQARADAGGHQLFNFALARVDEVDWNIKNTEPAMRLEFRIPKPSISFSLSALYTHQDTPVARFSGHYSVNNPNPAVMLFLQGLYNEAASSPVAGIIDDLSFTADFLGIAPFAYSGGASSGTGVWITGFDPYSHAAGGAPSGTLAAANQDLQNAWFMLMNAATPPSGCAGLSGSALAACAGSAAIFAMPWTASEATLEYPRIWSLGGSLDYQIPRVDTVLRVEMAADFDRRIQNTALLSQVDKSHVFQVAFGLDRATFIPFVNPNRTAFISLQTFVEHIVDYDDGRTRYDGMVPWETSVISTAFMQNFWRNDSLILTNFVAVDWISDAVIYGPSFRWVWNDHLSFDVGINLLWGQKQKHNLRDLCPDGGIDGATCTVRNPTTWQQGQWQMLNAGLERVLEHPYWSKESFADHFMRHRDEFWIGGTYQF